MDRKVRNVIGIIGAMEVEVAKLREAMNIRQTQSFAGMTFCSGELFGQEVVLVKSGIGKVNAAVCVQVLCDRFGVEQVWNTGIAGSLDDRIRIGDIVISSDAMQHDMDAVAFGYAKGVIPQMETSVFPADRAAAELAQQVCREEIPEIATFCGRVLSGDQFVADREKKQRLTEEFHGLCTEMEGAAVAQAAYLNGVPFLIVRAISDQADDSAGMDYDTFERLAIEHMVRLVSGMLKRMEKKALEN